MTTLKEPTPPVSPDSDPLAEPVLSARFERARSLALSDLPGALSESESLVDLVPPQHAARARVLALRGHILLYANRFAEALAVLDDALTRALAGGQAGEIGQVHLSRVQALARLGRMPEAEEAGRAAFAQLSAAGGAAIAGKAAANLGIVLRMQGRAAESLEWCNLAAERLTDPGSLGAVQSNRAEALLDLDRFDEAQAAFERARELLAGAGMDHAAAIAEGNLADLHSRAGRVETAVALFESARGRFERVGAAGDAARLLAEHADALLAAGLARRSVRMYREALHTLRDRGLARESARAALGLGLALSAIGNDRAAADELAGASEAARRSGDAMLEAETFAALGAATARADEPARAEPLLRRAIEQLRDRPVRRAMALCTLAEIESASRDAAVEPGLTEVQRVAERTGMTALHVRLEQAHGRRRLRSGDAPGADAHFRRAIEHVLHRAHRMQRARLRDASVLGAGPLFADALNAAVGLNEPARSRRVFELLEAWRGAEFRSGCEGIDAEPGDPELAAALWQLNMLYSRLGPAARSAVDPETVRQRVLALEERVLRRLDALGGGARADTDCLALDDALAALPPGAACVSYFECAGWIGALVLHAGRAKVLPRVAEMPAVRSLMRRCRLSADYTLAGMRRGPTWDALAEIDRVLIAPVIEDLDTVRTLMISPAPVLAGLPLCAAAGRRAMVSWTIPAMSPRVSTSLHGEHPGRGRALVVGVSDEHAPHMEPEARRVGARLAAAGQTDARVLCGPAAGAKDVLAALPDAPLVHLACHGIFDADFPLSSRLLLADRWVTARELAANWRRGATIVLAGCDTAGSAGAHADGAGGLARAALASGAGCVVGAQWALHDGVAAEFFELLHARLGVLSSAEVGSPGCVAQCVHAVQHQLAGGGKDWALWSGITVLGGVA